jgi:ankyrin repeat protein
MHLLALLPELLLMIANRLKSQRDINSFVQTSRQTCAVLNRYLYRSNVVNHGGWGIFEAAKENQQNSVQYFIDAGISKIEGWYQGPLFYASTYGHDPVLKVLLGAGAAPDFIFYENGRFQNPLVNACSGGHEEAVSLLLQYGANVNYDLDISMPGPLHMAARGGYESIIEILIRHGADIDSIVSDFHQTPLGYAISGEHDNAFRLLLSHGAKLSGQTLHLAAHYNAGPIAREIIKAGIDVDHRSESNKTPLFNSAARGSLDVARVLMKKGADVEARDSRCNAPLHIGTSEGQLNAVSLLLDFGGADVNAKGWKGHTPLHRLADHYVDCFSTEIATILLEKGASLESLNNYRETPLFLAVRNKSLAAIAFLINRGANLEHRNIRGETPIYCALRSHELCVIRLLYEAGCKTDVNNRLGETPLDIAAKQNTKTYVSFRKMLGLKDETEHE